MLRTLRSLAPLIAMVLVTWCVFLAVREETGSSSAPSRATPAPRNDGRFAAPSEPHQIQTACVEDPGFCAFETRIPFDPGVHRILVPTQSRLADE